MAESTGIAATTISAVLNGSRSLRKKHIVALSTFFNVAPAVFLPPSSASRAARDRGDDFGKSEGGSSE